MVEQEEAIVLGGIANLGTDVADLHARVGLVGAWLANRHEEELDAIVLPVNHETRAHARVVRVDTELSRPELGRMSAWCMQHELIRGLVKRRCCLDALR